MWAWLGWERCDILEAIPFCFSTNSFRVMSRHLIRVRERCVENADVALIRNTPALSLSLLFPLPSPPTICHTGSCSVAIEMKLDRASFISATRESFVWAKVLLVFCGKDFRSPEPSQNTEGILCNPNFTSATPRLLPWSFPSFHHLY